MTDQTTRQSIRQFTADPQAPKGRMLRALERSGVDVLGAHARSMEDWGMSHCVRVEALLIDEERGVVVVGETHEKLEESACRALLKGARSLNERVSRNTVGGVTGSGFGRSILDPLYEVFKRGHSISSGHSLST